MKVEYSSNNSGGNWWLSDEDWKNLESAGWVVNWFSEGLSPYVKSDRFLGALATGATREGLSLDDAVAEFERVTGQDAYAGGCPCCGEPHFFEEVE